MITPRRVAELLVLRDDMPRSLHCMHEPHRRHRCEMLCDDSSARARAHRAGELHARLHYGRTGRHHRSFGLHEYLMDFLERELGAVGERGVADASSCRWR